MKFITSTIALILLLTVSACAQGKYKVIAPLNNVSEGTTAYIMNLDNMAVVDSAAVSSEGAAVFAGKIDEPILAYVVVNDQPVYMIILEEGTTAINAQLGQASGLMLNDQLNAINDSIQTYVAKMQGATSPEEGEAYYVDLIDYAKGEMMNNIDNPIGYFLLSNVASDMTPAELIALVDANPQLGQYEKVQNMVATAKVKEATSEGKPFVDFEVEYDGKIQKLSDYVGNGKFTLVDFWASWCRPCREEMATIKEIYNEYHDKGLEVLGVAVWDEPENTLAAIKDLQLPWPVIINAQKIASDAYGIPAIPCIILFGPDGVIVSRDARGEELKRVVAEAMKANL